MFRYRFDALVSFKGNVFNVYHEVDADSLYEAFKAAKAAFGKKYVEFEIHSYNFLWKNERI